MNLPSDVLELLNECYDQFHKYEDLHLAKNTPESYIKAADNLRFKLKIREVLSKYEPTAEDSRDF